MSDRKEELKQVLEEEGLRLRKGKVLGQGRWRTRLNWGFYVLLIGFVLFIIWLVMR